jgi:hypothetical protein
MLLLFWKAVVVVVVVVVVVTCTCVSYEENIKSSITISSFCKTVKNNILQCAHHVEIGGSFRPFTNYVVRLPVQSYH